MRWEKLELSSRIRATPEERRSAGQVDEIFGPGRRWGHSCNAIQGGKFLYVFGGYCTDTSQTNDVHVFDTVRQIWSKPTMRGIPPSPRDSHSCTTVGNNLFVFGGTDGSNPLKDLHILDTSSNTWISPGVGGEGPAAREGHSASLIDKQIFIFGGCRKPSNSSYEVYYNDLYILDTETLVWKRAVTSGTPPSARDSHTCSSWMNKIIVIGGEDPSGYYLSDVHILDTDTLVWRELSTSGHMLPPRAGHSTVAVGRNLFVFGGFTDARNLYDDLHMFTLDTGVWTNVMAAGQGPCARFSVAGDCLFPQKGVLVFIGGCNRLLEALDDMFYLHTEISMENGQDEQKQEKFSLRKELKRKCHEQCLPVSLPINNKDVPKYETIPDLRLSMPMSSYGQAGKQNLPLHEFKPPKEMRFEAKVIDAFHYGYTIETTIDGKTLRGIIFSHTPGFSHAANDYLSRKRTHLEIGDVKLNDSYRPKLETTRPIRPERIDHRQTDGVHVKESASQESQMETAIASQPNNKMPIDVSQIHVVRENSETSMAPLPEVKNDSKNEPPNASTEVPCDNCSTTDKNMVTAPPN